MCRGRRGRQVWAVSVSGPRGMWTDACGRGTRRVVSQVCREKKEEEEEKRKKKVKERAKRRGGKQGPIWNGSSSVNSSKSQARSRRPGQRQRCKQAGGEGAAATGEPGERNQASDARGQEARSRTTNTSVAAGGRVRLSVERERWGMMSFLVMGSRSKSLGAGPVMQQGEAALLGRGTQMQKSNDNRRWARPLS